MIGILLLMVVMYVFSGNGCLWRGVVVRLEEQGADAHLTVCCRAGTRFEGGAAEPL